MDYCVFDTYFLIFSTSITLYDVRSISRWPNCSNMALVYILLACRTIARFVLLTSSP
uniref:Uncharacterized protein n=1 Tax=Triticum urartu TaxID=4572 RepID=A0A8R7QXN8_TRIUA